MITHNPDAISSKSSYIYWICTTRLIGDHLTRFTLLNFRTVKVDISLNQIMNHPMYIAFNLSPSYKPDSRQGLGEVEPSHPIEI